MLITTQLPNIFTAECMLGSEYISLPHFTDKKKLRKRSKINNGPKYVQKNNDVVEYSEENTAQAC